MNSDASTPSSEARLRALAAMECQQWADALDAWETWWGLAAQTANQDPDAMHDRAVCLLHCKRTAEALRWLDLAVDCQPDYSYRYASRGWMKQAAQDLDGALADYKKALELDPDDAITWNNLGLLEERMGYQQQAQERFKVSDELLGILKANGIDTERAPATSGGAPDANLPQKTTAALGPNETANNAPRFWAEMRRAMFTSEGRNELWGFIRNGFTLRH
jgi:tetratricopeptide (TPR) repeat protein